VLSAWFAPYEETGGNLKAKINIFDLSAWKTTIIPDFS
jgi:hypothetical protein